MQLLTCSNCSETWYEFGDTYKCPYCKQPFVELVVSTETSYIFGFGSEGYGSTDLASNQITYNYLTKWK